MALRSGSIAAVSGHSKSPADRQQLLHSGRQAMQDCFGLVAVGQSPSPERPLWRRGALRCVAKGCAQCRPRGRWQQRRGLTCSNGCCR